MVTYEIIESDKILARTYISATRIKSMMLLSIYGSRVEVKPFDVETSCTVFENNPVAVFSANNATPALMADLASYIKGLNHFDIAGMRDYLIKLNLLFTENAGNDACVESDKPILIVFKSS